MTRLIVNDVRLEVRVRGRGEPVLLLHGFTGRGSSLGSLARALRRHGHRTISVDLLGHGRSDAPRDPTRYSVDCQADVLASLLRRLHAQPAHVVGYSMGARIGLRLAIDHPGSVGSLTLESPSAGIQNDEERRRRRADDEALAAGLEHDGLAPFVERWEAQPVFASQATLAPSTRWRLRDERVRNRPEGLAGSLRGAGQGTMLPIHGRLGEINVPSLVVVGALDEPGSERARAVASGIRRARLVELAGVGHAPHLERPRTFNRLVADFLTMQTTATEDGLSRPAIARPT